MGVIYVIFKENGHMRQNPTDSTIFKKMLKNETWHDLLV